jgi:hypothetical protein
MSSFDAESELVRHTWLLELVAVPKLASSFNWAVGPINRQKTIAANISNLLLFEVDLRRGEAPEDTMHILDD